MRRQTCLDLALVLLLGAAVAAPTLALADHPAAATRADLRELRAEANRLDDSLSTLEEGHPRASEFRERQAEIREDLVWLSEEIRRHRQDDRQGTGATQEQVASLRREIESLRRDIDSTTASTRSAADVPNGTEIEIRLEEPVSSKTARVEDRVEASVAQPVRTNGRVAIPAGTEVRGLVETVQRAERPAKGGRLELSFESLVLDGRTVPIDARVVELEEGGIDKRKAGLGAAIGGVLGAVLDGGKGALIGAILGGTGTVVATGGEEVELPAGTILKVRLERPLALAR